MNRSHRGGIVHFEGLIVLTEGIVLIEGESFSWFFFSLMVGSMINVSSVSASPFQAIRKTIRSEIYDYLQALPLEYDVELNGTHYKLVHAAPVDQFKPYWRDFGSPRRFAVWKRWYRGEFPATDYTLVFGHTPTEEYQYDNPLKIYYRDNVIGIDCGSGFPDKLTPWSDSQGRLACLRLDDLCEFYSEEHYET